MKKIIAICTLSLVCLTGWAEELTFRNTSMMNTKLGDFNTVLTKMHGFKEKKPIATYQVYVGSYANTNVLVQARGEDPTYHPDAQMSELEIWMVKKQGSWALAKDKYDYLKTMLTKKFGEPAEENEVFTKGSTTEQEKNIAYKKGDLAYESKWKDEATGTSIRLFIDSDTERRR